MSEAHYAGSAGWVGHRKGPNDPPDTPWRAHYGGFSHPKWYERHSSGLAPLYPSISTPIGMEAMSQLKHAPPLDKPLPDAMLDRLFTNERFQSQHSYGLKNWQVPSINAGLPDPANVRFGTDERYWHPVFTRSHWFDYHNPTDPSQSWLASNDAFWEELKIPLEMANRLLRHLLQTRWYGSPNPLFPKYSILPSHLLKYPTNGRDRLQAMLMGGITPVPHTEDLGPFYASAPPGTLGPMFLPIYNEAIAMTNQERQALLQMTMQLSRCIVWTVLDTYDAQRYGHREYAQAQAYAFTRTYWEAMPQPFVAIKISTQILKTLVTHRGATPDERAERYLTQFHLAITVGKEIFRSLHDEHGTTSFEVGAPAC